MTAAIVALVMAVGVAGTIVPFVPGLGLIVAAAIGYGVVDGFGGVGVVATAIIVALAAAGTVAGFVLPTRAAGGAGATRSSLLVGALGAIVGFFVVPVVGLPLGGAIGIYVAERVRTGDHAAAWRTTLATVKGIGVGTLVQFGAGMAMVLVWLAWVVID